MFNSKKNAVIHDYFEFPEGGGRLCITLAKGLKAHLIYGFKTANHPYFLELNNPLKEYNLDLYCNLRVLKQLKLIHAFKKLPLCLDRYQTVIYSGFYSLCSIFERQSGINIHYCHTPPRYIYDQRDQYLSQASLLGKLILFYFIKYYKPLYEEALTKMDCILTNSINVQKRIKNHIGIESIVVYPPCDLEKFRYIGQEPYYLSMARHEPLKRVKNVVKAFIGMPRKRLIVVSCGSEFNSIRRLASGHHNITILGRVNENHLRDLIGNCIATIYIPKEEDFGMSPVESMASGKPVIGVNEGGMNESIIDGETGRLLPADPTIEQLQESIRWLTGSRAIKMRHTCRNRSEFFSSHSFLRRMNEVIHNI